jgi:hypothetical protein
MGIALKGFQFLLPAALSQVILWIYLGYTLSKISYVKYRN